MTTNRRYSEETSRASIAYVARRAAVEAPEETAREVKALSPLAREYEDNDSGQWRVIR